MPFLLEAAGRCPPEDVGGAPGYAEYLDAIGDSTHPEHEHMRRWGPGAVQSQRDRPEGPRGRRQRIVRNLEATSAKATIKIGRQEPIKRAEELGLRSNAWPAKYVSAALALSPQP
nr:plasmid pRiA4b ORF-3 family protein [Bradyrhizobium sp. 41S5]